MTQRLFLLQPAVVLAAQVNGAAFTYPLAQFTYDNVTAGSYTNVRPGMTLLLGSSPGLSNRGRQRVRAAPSSTIMYIGRSSQGVHDGEIELLDNLYLTVLNDYRVWAKIPFIDTTGNQFKDHDIAPSGYWTQPPPVANAGVGMAGTIDVTTQKLRVQLPHVTNSSFATAHFAAISAYSWTLPTGVTLVSGYTTSMAQIQVDCDPGFYWVILTVTDSNAVQHSAVVPIFARDPIDDDTISKFQINSHRIRPRGQDLEIRVLDSIPEGTYPDGTLAMIWEDEPIGPADRSHMLFCGWHQEDPAQLHDERTGYLTDTTLRLLDVAGKLDILPGFPQVVGGISSAEFTGWTYIQRPNMDKYIHYLLQWHSTALDVADWTWSGTGDSYVFVTLGSDGESIWDQCNRRCNSMVPNHLLVCDRLGRLAMRPDPILQDPLDRTATVIGMLNPSDYSDIRYTQQRHPRVHWLRSSALQAHGTDIIPLFSVAPGNAPGQGELAQEHDEQLAIDQDGLNICEGNRYARMNAPQSLFSIQLVSGTDLRWEPALLAWLRLSIPITYAAQRGLEITVDNGLIQEMDIRYDYRPGGLVKQISLQWERETEGRIALTVIPPAGDLPPDDSDDFPPPPPPGPEEPGPEGHRDVVLVNSDKYLYQTGDFHTPESAGGPTWERVLMNWDGSLRDFVVDPFSPRYLGTGTQVNGWIVTNTKIYRLTDMFAVTPGMTLQYTFNYPTPAGTEFRTNTRAIHASFGAFFGATGPAWVMAISNYLDADPGGTNIVYSTDSGATWSNEIHIGGYETGGWTSIPCLYLSPRTPGLAYTIAPPYSGFRVNGQLLRSTDWGATWVQVSTTEINVVGGLAFGGLHVPWPANADEKFMYHGYEEDNFNAFARIRRVSGAVSADISPYLGINSFGSRGRYFNIRTYDNDRRYVVLAAIGGTKASITQAVFLSSDYGDTWTNIIPSPSAVASAAFASNTPDILYFWGFGTIRASYNLGVTIQNKKGNITTDFPDFADVRGFAGGTP